MTRLVFETMGTVASLIVPGDRRESLSAKIETVFTDADHRFSLYRPDSEASAVARGDAMLTAASEQFRNVYALANDWRQATAGAFTSHRPDGVIDLSGVVKAWAMREAELSLEAAGVESWCLNVGGDVSVRGFQLDGTPWSVGIVDPAARDRLLTAITLREPRRAVATSGSAERGDHIWRTGDPSQPSFVQVSVVADDIVTADVLATAIVSAGPGELEEFARAWPIDVLAITDDGRLFGSPSMRRSAKADDLSHAHR